MIQLTERQRLIIKDLLNINNPISTKELAKKFNLSIRTIRYDLEAIEYWLKTRNIILIKRPNVGIWLDLKKREKDILKGEIITTNRQISVLSKVERFHYILFELLKSIEPVTAEFLANELGVSRTTIMKDLKEVKQELNKYEVELRSKPRIGYRVIGNEENIRKLIGDILIENMSSQELLLIVSNIDKKTKNNENSSFNIESLNNLSKQINIKDIKKAIKLSKETNDFWIPDSSYVSLLVHIAIAMDRLLKGQNIELSPERIDMIKDYKEYQIADEIGERLSEIYGVTVPEDEIANITLHLISSNLKLEYLCQENIFDTKDKLSEVVDKMIKVMKEYVLLSEYSYDKLKIDLLSHLKLTLKKYELNIISDNPLLDQIKANYCDLFDIARKMSEVFKTENNIELPESEIGYIALHLAAHIEISKQKKKKKALVVCTTGKGSAKILAMRIKNCIPQLDIVETVSMFELEDKHTLLNDIDLIISTVYLKSLDKPVIKVSPLINNIEINKIKSFINEEKSNIQLKEIQQGNYMLESIMNVVDKYISREDKEKLKMELSYLTGFLVNNSNKPTKQIEISERFAQMNSLILVEIGEMLKEISEKIEVNSDISSLWGIVIHIVMSIYRWKAGKYYKEKDFQKYKKENPEIYAIIKAYLDKISEDYDLEIPDTETVAIMRYLI